MSNTDLETGDYVFIQRPENVEERLGWVRDMDKFDGTIMKVKWYDGWVALISGGGWSFNRKWCTKVSPPDSD